MPHMDGLTLPTIALRSMEMLDDVISTIRRLHQPVIAAVNGAAIGGGFCLALAADIRIAADERLLPGGGHQQRTDRGRTRAQLPAAAGGRPVAGRRDHADRAGTSTRPRRTGSGWSRGSSPAPTLLPACFELADRIIGWSRAGVELTKRQLWNSLDASSLQSHMDAEGTAQLFVRITTRNFEESVAARKEGRTPDFKD